MNALLHGGAGAELLVGTGVKSLLLLALVAAAMLGWRRGSGAARHFVWLTALASLPLLPLVAVLMPPLPVPAWANQTERLNDWVLNRTLTGNATQEQNAAAPAPAQTRMAPPQAAKDSPAPAAGRTIARHQGLVLGWLAGVVVALLGMLVKVALLKGVEHASRPMADEHCLAVVEQERNRLGMHRRVQVLQSAQSLMPMTWGWWRAVVLLPPEAAQWAEDRLRLVVRHELAHVKRWDCLTQGLSQLACALFWFNPLAWLAAREMRRERERACDDLVLDAGARPSEYAGHLLDIARQFSVSEAAAIAMARPSNLEQRLRQIVDASRKPGGLRPVSALLILTAFSAGTLLFLAPKTPLIARDLMLTDTLKLPRVQTFIAAKQRQAEDLARGADVPLPDDFKAFFGAGAKGDWQSFTNGFSALSKKHQGPDKSYVHLWQPVLESLLFFENNRDMTPRYVEAIGRDMMEAIPPGSIFFGGTDPGRGLPTGLSKSHADADPFFTLTQNALADGTYLTYLRAMYGKRIQVPTAEDSQACFTEYMQDAQRRLAANQLKPGEEVRMENGRMQVSGQVAVMAINGLLARIIFDKNPDQQFYVEESFPLEWMYPHLSPHGLILKLNREPVTTLKPEDMERDQKYWESRLAGMIGNWLTEATPVKEVTEYAEKVFREKNLQDFQGDARLVRNDAACRTYSKLRSAIAGVYVWRLNAKAPAVRDDKQRLDKAADYAFRQAFALCPYSPEAVYRYTNYLVTHNRVEDAILIVQTALSISASNESSVSQLKDLLKQLKQMKATPKDR